MIASPAQILRLSPSAPRRWSVPPDLAAVAAFLGLALLLVAPALRPGYAFVPWDILSTIAPWERVVPGPPHNGILSDPVFVAYPFRHYLASNVREGRLPLWNPNILAGHPSFADPEAETFYPLTWLLARALPLPVTFAVDAWIHLALAGLLMYGFMRAMGVSPLAASVAGLIWMLNSFRISWLTFPALTHTAAWLPGVFWGYELGSGGRFRGIALGAVCLGWMLLASWFQFTLYGLLLLAAYVGWRSWEVGRRLGVASGGRDVGAALGILILGTALGAVALLPLIEFALLSHRDVFDRATLLATHLPWYALVTLVAPNFFGSHLHGQYFWGPGNHNECVAYFGATGLLLAGIAPWVDRRAARFWLIAGIVLLALLLGTPLAQLLDLVPALNRFSLSRLLFLVPFVGGVLAALGLQGLLAGGKPLRASRGVALYGCGGALAGLMLAACLTTRQLGAQSPYSWQQLAVAIGWWLLAGLACYRGTLPSTSRLGWVRSIPLLLAVNLLVTQMGRNPAVPARFAYPPRPILAALSAAAAGGRVLPLHADKHVALGPNVAAVLGLWEADGYASLTLKSYREFIDLMGEQVRFPAMRSNLNILAFSDYHPRLMDFLGVRAFASAAPLSLKPGSSLAPVARGDGLIVYRNSHALPRAFLVRDAEVIPGRRARLARLADPALDLTRSVVLTSVDEVPRAGERGKRQDRPSAFARSLPTSARPSAQRAPGSPARAGSPARVGSPGSAEILADRGDTVAVAARATDPCYLTVSDAYYPGWGATVDGRRTSLLRADHAFRAIRLPAGKSTVVFRFEPALLRISLFVSLLAAMFTGALVAAAAGRATPRT